MNFHIYDIKISAVLIVNMNLLNLIQTVQNYIKLTELNLQFTINQSTNFYIKTHMKLLSIFKSNSVILKYDTDG